MSYRRTKIGLSVALAACALVAAAPGRADTTDLTDLVDAAAQRLSVAEPVAAFKWRNAVAVEDPARVQQELATLSAEATTGGVDPAYITTLMRDQINATESLEYSRFAQWKLDPGGAPDAPDDLSASRAAIDDLNNAMVAQIGLRWDLLHSPGCPAQLDSALRHVSGARRLDPLYQQALRFATHSYCRS